MDKVLRDLGPQRTVLLRAMYSLTSGQERFTLSGWVVDNDLLAFASYSF